ncbi:thiamine-phosphate kinase [Methylobacterium sp. B4]|uniref:thiamine-phosphate kinase n=1 Tax=Methylobacterium sp. B4 TaxID=1938755 RepID=UPI000D77105A|nr:thiamine-phosphate kinase [Methylobacterium sp. B4]PXW66559.1 thiamine-phosphate kinase [Methylobacterium sp. B4]
MARAGEEALIARYFAPLAGPGAEGLRDDAASLTPTPGHDLVVTADAIVAGVHYFPDDPPGSIAVKALGVNLSDLAAKGASPRGFLLTLALPDDWTEDWLAAFAEGLGGASRAHGCPLLGGDTVRSGGPALIGVTAFGEVPAGAMLRRQAARAGDRLCVSGSIGDAALGLALHLTPDPALDPVHGGALRERYLHPRPRLALVPALRRHARAAMDVSDGLAGDLAKMFAGTGLTARVEAGAVPLSQAARAAVTLAPERLATALTGGDDYEILCAVAPEHLPAFIAEARAAGVPAAEIGSVEAGDDPPLFLDGEGCAMDFARTSFSHF